MGMPLSERRQIENEMIFRRANELVGDNLDELDEFHIEDDNPELIRDDKVELHFKCECSDENCDERVRIKLSVYQAIHANRQAFIIKPNHQVEAIEKVVVTEKDYSVVEKNNATAEPSDVLNETNVDNSESGTDSTS